MSDAHKHIDPEFYLANGFCPTSCDACDALDRAEIEAGQSSADSLRKAISLTTEAFMRNDGLCHTKAAIKARRRAAEVLLQQGYSLDDVLSLLVAAALEEASDG